MTNEHVAASCVGKTPYESKGAAIKVLNHRHKEKRIRARPGCFGPPVPYHCRFCHSWHIGSNAR